MSQHRRDRTRFLAGIAIVAVSNAVTLAYAAYNRAGQPDSELRLTNQELSLNGDRTRDENSGVAVSLAWCAEPSVMDTLGMETGLRFFDCGGRDPGFLDQERLGRLGFDVASPPATARERSDWSRERARKVLLVFELDGPQRQRVVESARQRLTAVESDRATRPDSAGHQARVERLRRAYERLEAESSRLYVIDAGTDRDSLRGLYPDRTRYAIIRGLVRPYFPSATVGPGKTTGGVRGMIQRIEGDVINVPARYRQPVLAHVRTRFVSVSGSNPPALEVDVAFGKRLEPWISRVHARPR